MVEVLDDVPQRVSRYGEGQFGGGELGSIPIIAISSRASMFLVSILMMVHILSISGMVILPDRTTWGVPRRP